MKLAPFAILAVLAAAGSAAALQAPGLPVLPSAARELDGVVRDAYGLLAPPGHGSPEAIARGYLDGTFERLGIPEGAGLVLTSVRESLTARHLRFDPVLDGVPVANAEVSVHVRSDGAIVAVHSRAPPAIRGGAEAVTAETAAASAGALAPGDVTGVRAVIWARGLEGIPAWEVSLHQPLPLSAWRVVVDKQSGEILDARDLVHSAEAKANVWINPIVASGNADMRDSQTGLDKPLTPAGPAQRDFTPYYTEATLLDLAEGGATGAILLEGPHVVIADALASGSDMRFPKHDPRFEEAMAYHWIDWSQRNIQALGFADVVAYPIPVYLHDQLGLFNAFYSPNGDGTGDIHFGWHAPVAGAVGTGPSVRGFADAAEDAEVILHEYGHAVVDSIVPNFNGGPLHEGFGDFWAATQASRVSNGNFDWCMAEWFTSYLGVTSGGRPPCLRTLENELTFDYESGGHAMGQIWSGALWNLRKELGREETEKLVLEAYHYMPTTGSFHEGAEALLMADAELNGAQNARLILREFAERKVTDLIVTPELLEKIQAADLGVERAFAEGILPSGTQTNATPGFEVLAGLGALGAMALAGGRRRT